MTSPKANPIEVKMILKGWNHDELGSAAGIDKMTAYALVARPSKRRPHAIVLKKVADVLCSTNADKEKLIKEYLEWRISHHESTEPDMETQ